MHDRRRLGVLFTTIAMTTTVALAAPDKKAPPPSKERPSAAAQGVKVLPGADAPAPPDEGARLKKTPINEYNKNPGKKEIKLTEELIYNLEKPQATIWEWKQDPEGRSARDVGYVVKKMADLDAAFAALKAKEPGWHRIDDYARRITFLKTAAAAQAGHYDNVAAAKDGAVAAADAQAQADWLARRVTDEGVTSDVHKRSVGKILFAKAALATSGAGATEQVDVGDPLFVRAYFPESPWNFLHTGGIDCSPRGRTVDDVYWIRTWAQINGGDPIELETMTLDRATMQTRTTSALTAAASLTKGGAYSNPDEKLMPFRWLTRVAAKLKPGSNKVKLESMVWCAGATYAGKSIASGEVTIRATAAQLAEVGKRGTFKLTASTHPKAKLTRWQTAMTRHYGGKWELLDLRTAGEWQLHRDEKTTVVLSRDAPAVVLLRNKADAYCELVSVVLSEPFDGRTYGPQVEWGFETPRPFVCNVQ